jgi:ribulose-5-phosphate 4-epimerase/fuculose-1-phosphate aldolase
MADQEVHLDVELGSRLGDDAHVADHPPRPRVGKFGPEPAALMRGHGSVVVGEDLQRAVGRSMYLETSARLQMQAMLIAGPRAKITWFDAAEVKAAVPRQNYARAWDLWRKKALAHLKAERGALLP